MADIGMQRQWLVSPTAEIEQMWKHVQIQEKRSTINRYRQDIEDLTKGRMLDLQAKILMLELEIRTIEMKLKDNQPVETTSVEADLIENNGGTSNG